jgi:hypothetical protein
MRTKKLQGPCIVCETVVDMRYRSVTELGLKKARASKTNVPDLKLGDILCHNCYMAIVEWDRYEKQKSKIEKQSNKDHFSNENYVTMSQKDYENLFEKAKKVEELRDHIIQLEVALEQAMS